MIKKLVCFGAIVSLLLIPLRSKADFKLIPSGEGTAETIANTGAADSGPFNETFSIPDSIAEFYEYAASDTILRVAVVLSDIYSKKDMEFTRGLLMGIKHARLPENSISLKVINGEIPEDSLQYELELFGPHTVLSTFEKDAPRTLLAYSRENGSNLLNIFDARNDDYLYNDHVFQLLAPTNSFNSAVSSYIFGNFNGNVLILVGDPDPTDSSIRDLILSWPEEDLMILTKEDLDIFEFEEERNYLIYPLFTANDEVKDVIAQTVKLASLTPSAGVRIFGRPNWIAFNDLNSMISNMEVYIPARCYFDASTDKGKKFISGYNAMFGHAPIRSYPVYAVMGYDAASYFLPLLLNELKGLPSAWNPQDLQQSYFDFEKSDFGGYFNTGGYILHFEPWGTMQKDLIGRK